MKNDNREIIRWITLNNGVHVPLYEGQSEEDATKNLQEFLKGKSEMIQMKNTINLMLSDNYKERFLGEYWQTKIRYERLKSMTTKYEAGTLQFTPSCSLEVLREQQKYMGQYLHMLEVRAEIENIDLKEVDV